MEAGAPSMPAPAQAQREPRRAVDRVADKSADGSAQSLRSRPALIRTPVLRLCPGFSACLTALCVVSTLGSARLAGAAPYIPASDDEVVERLPARASDPAALELAALRSAWQRDPRDAALAVPLARRYYEESAASGDPRFVGYAQAALAPWWSLPAPPTDVRVLRAILKQFEHRFDESLADLHAAVAAEPGHAEAWSWIAAIQMVRADYAAARQACTALAPLTTALIASACGAYVDAMTGRAARAAAQLRAALQAAAEADAGQRLWALTRLAETEERRGAYGAAEAAFRAALALDVEDVYLLAAYADFLLDRGRAPEVLDLLRERTRADVLLLRAALAARTVGDRAASTWTSELGARFDAARARGDTSHRKEESRFVLALLGDAARALRLAQANYAEQREVADARLLLEAALAARQPAAAKPVLDWMAANGVESAALQALAGKLKGLR